MSATVILDFLKAMDGFVGSDKARDVYSVVLALTLQT